MGQEALTSMLQEAVRKGQLGDVDSIEVTDNIPGKPRVCEVTGSFEEGHGLSGIVCLRFDTFYLCIALF